MIIFGRIITKVFLFYKEKNTEKNKIAFKKNEDLVEAEYNENNYFVLTVLTLKKK
jgi:hypothetical protein